MTPLGIAAGERPPGAEAPPRGRAAAWVEWVLLAMVAATPLLAYLGNLGFAPALALAGLLVAPLALRRGAPWTALGVLAAGCAWAVASAGWSPFRPPPPHSFRDVEQLTAAKLVLQLVTYGAFLAALVRVTPAGAARALRIGAYLLAGLSVLLLVEAVDGAQLYQLIRSGAHVASTREDWAKRDMARATYVLALLFWPTALVLSRRSLSWLAATMFVATLLAGILLHVDSPLVSLVLSGGAFALVRYNGRPGIAVVAAGVLAYAALAPVAVALAGPVLNAHLLAGAGGGVGKASWAVRLHVWSFVDQLIHQKPLVGWGLDASRAWPGVIPLHPHDGALQVWFELGVPGVLIEVLFWSLLLAAIWRLNGRDPGAAAAACGSLLSYVIIGALSFGVWQEWWLALGALAVAWTMLLDRGGHEDEASALPDLRPA